MSDPDLHVVGEAAQPVRVVLLHGHAGSPEAMLDAAVALAGAAPVQVVLPRGPLVAEDGWAWWRPGSPCERSTVDGVLDVLGADARPTVLAGFSQGGAMALLAGAARAPVAALVVVAGFVPDELAPQAAGSLALPPVLVLHGEGDEAVDVLHGRRVARWCERVGARTVEVGWYEAGHDWAPETTARLAAWLRRQLAV
jgi:predicted esterase